MGILRTLQRLRAMNKFDKLVPPELIAKLEQSGEIKNTIETKHFQFVLVNVEEKEPSEIPAIIGKIADAFSRALLAENGDRIRIAHGQCSGGVGNFGTKGHWRYGAIIPGFTAILKKLLDAPFGSAVEIS